MSSWGRHGVRKQPGRKIKRGHGGTPMEFRITTTLATRSYKGWNYQFIGWGTAVHPAPTHRNSGGGWEKVLLGHLNSREYHRKVHAQYRRHFSTPKKKSHTPPSKCLEPRQKSGQPGSEIINKKRPISKSRTQESQGNRRRMKGVNYLKRSSEDQGKSRSFTHGRRVKKANGPQKNRN